MLLLPRFELVLVVLFDKAAMLSTRHNQRLAWGNVHAVLREAIKSAIDTISRLQLPSVAHLKSGRVHLEAVVD